MAITLKVFLKQKETQIQSTVVGSWIDNKVYMNTTKYSF